MKAYILLNLKLGTEDTAEKLRQIPNSHVARTYGAYDIVLTLYDTDSESMKNIITWSVRKLDSVVSALTLTSLDHSRMVEAS